MLEARSACWQTNGKSIITDISLDLRKGEFLGLAGPNGSGKSTLISLLGGLRRPSAGAVLLENRPLSQFPRQTIARRIALIEQQADTSERITARQVVALGRTPHLSAFSLWTGRDAAITQEALRKVDMLAQADRPWQILSGGERQRLQLARALAQQPDILLLDEPTNHLDIKHQLALLGLIRREGRTTLAALHDLNHAAMFCDRLGVLNHGRLVAFGKPHDVLTAELIRDIFHVEAIVQKTPAGYMHIRYIRMAGTAPF